MIEEERLRAEEERLERERVEEEARRKAEEAERRKVNLARGVYMVTHLDYYNLQLT